jgi:hypothetical protein
MLAGRRVGRHAFGIRTFLAQGAQPGEHRKFRFAEHFLEIDLAAFAERRACGSERCCRRRNSRRSSRRCWLRR